MNTLAAFGWTDERATEWQSLQAQGSVPGRVVADFGTSFHVAIPEITSAELTGHLAHRVARTDVPKVGDWVQVRLSDNSAAVIKSVLQRQNSISRRAAGSQTKQQVLAANIDVAFIVLALDADFSVDRLRRFLYQLSTEGIAPIIVLNKADKTDDLERFTSQLVSFNLPIITTVATSGTGIDELAASIGAGKTAILLGSSGVGKSTLTNALLKKQVQKTQPTRESDDTGKHTTIHRELFMLSNGGMLIDTPGIRELQLWGELDGLQTAFEDIALLTAACQYSSCQHQSDAGCAIQEALRDGRLAQSRYDAFLTMKNELTILQTRTTARAKADSRKLKSSKLSQNYDEREERGNDL